MDTIPRNDFILRHRYDAFCKAVLRNEAKDYLREMGQQRDREKSLDALTQQELDKLSTVDYYPSDSYVFSSHGQRACSRGIRQPATTRTKHFDFALCFGFGRRRNRKLHGNVPQRRTAPQDKHPETVAFEIDGAHARGRETRMKEPTFNGRKLLPLSVMEAAHAGDAMAMEQVLRYYAGYINKLCTRTLYDSNGIPYVCVDEYMKHRLELKLIHSIIVALK